MRFIIEFDGPVIDLRPVHYQVYRDVAADVGWARIDEATYRRRTRARGREANILPGARPVKLATFHTRFDEQVEADVVVEQYQPHPDLEGVLATMARSGPCHLVTLGSNLEARRRVLERHDLARFFTRRTALHPDPRRRGGELLALSNRDPRTIVAASTDAIIRAAGHAALFAVGIASGMCAPERLHQAGADVVYSDLNQLAESLTSGAGDLIKAGLLPPPSE